MCLPFFTLTFCAVFAAAPAPSGIQAVAPADALAATPAGPRTAERVEPAVATTAPSATVSADADREARRDAFVRASARSEPREPADKAGWTTTEPKSSGRSSDAASGPTDTEQK